MSSPLGIPGVQQPDEIGRGGFGTVYRAEEPEFGRSVAVKIIHDRVDDDEVRRAFVRECQAMGRLSGHPHIVTVHRGGTTELGRPYILMDMMDGGSLADRLDREGPLPWPDVLEIGISVAGALETAHRAGILHLDVKPANILMSRYGEPKLADFGISRLPGVTATSDGRVRASIAYAAPERLLDGSATPASDLYALGSTLYTLLVGDPAFATKSGEDLLVAIARIVRQPVPDLRGHGVPDPVARVVERLLAKSPLDRFTTAADVALALQAAQRATGRPVTRAVVEGAPVSRSGGSSRPPLHRAPRPEDELADPEQDPPLTRPRYVPKAQPDWRDRSAATLAAADTDLVTIIPLPRPPVRSVAAAPAGGGARPNTALPAESESPTVVDLPRPPTEPTESADGPTDLPNRRPILLAIALATLVMLALTVGLLLSRAVAPPARPAVVDPGGAAISAPPSSALSSAALSSAALSSAALSSAALSSAALSAAPTRQIAVAGGVTHPDRDEVVDRLDGYFRALNDRDYEKAFDYFSPDSAVAGNGLAAFRRGNSTTRVLRQRIVAIEDLSGDGVRATVSYRSTQDAEFGPNRETCTNWNLAYELVGAPLQIRRARAVTEPQAC